jgi:hypothetical protein
MAFWGPSNLFRVQLLISTRIPKHRGRVLRERLKLAMDVASGQNHAFLLGLLCVALQPRLVPFPGDALDLCTPAIIVAWFRNNVKYVALFL